MGETVAMIAHDRQKKPPPATHLFDGRRRQRVDAFKEIHDGILVLGRELVQGKGLTRKNVGHEHKVA